MTDFMEEFKDKRTWEEQERELSERYNGWLGNLEDPGLSVKITEEKSDISGENFVTVALFSAQKKVGPIYPAFLEAEYGFVKRVGEMIDMPSERLEHTLEKIMNKLNSVVEPKK